MSTFRFMTACRPSLTNDASKGEDQHLPPDGPEHRYGCDHAPGRSGSRRDRLHLAAALLALTLTALAPSGAAQTTTASSRDIVMSGPAFDTALLAEVNQVRASHGLRPFAADTRLAGAAQRHAADMAQARRMEHQIAGRPSFPSRLRTSGARVRTAGENILRSHLGRFTTGCSAAAAAAVPVRALARDSVQRWMGSPKHRESILNPRFQRVGAGFAVVAAPDACGQIYVTQVFGG